MRNSSFAAVAEREKIRPAPGFLLALFFLIDIE